MKTLALILCSLATLSAQADVVIYSLTQTNTWAGGGRKGKSIYYGRIVIDVEFGTAQIISWLQPTKYFALDCPNISFKYLRGPNNSNESAWFLSGSGYDELGQEVTTMHIYLRGTNANLLIDVDHPLLAPKVLRGTYRGSQEGIATSSGETYVSEGTLVAIYAGPETKAANANALTGPEVTENWKQNRLVNGYTEVWPDAPCF